MLLGIFCIIIKILLAGIVIIKLFSKLTLGWCKSNTCLVGKTVIITGGNSGIGYQTASVLAGRGAKVIIADVADTKESVDNIKRETGNPHIKGKYINLASLESVRKFCEEIYEEESCLDILINNAGIGGLPLSHTTDGLQVHMQINYFGHFLLTHLLIDLLKQSQRSRIIFVSSIAAFSNNLTIDNLNNPTIMSNEGRMHFTIYSNSKICELIASNIFAEKLRNVGITSNAVYPGCVITPIFTNTVGPDFKKWGKFVIYSALKVGGKTAYEGAQTQINCALSRDLENVSGEFFVDCIKFFQPSLAKDREFCKKIWQKSEELVKLRPEEKLDQILKKYV